MKTLIRKEIRLLLPAWIAALLLVVLPTCGGALFKWPSDGGILFYPFGLGLLLLSLSPFGQELGQGTFSLLLTQPTARLRIWRIKVALLAIAVFSVISIMAISVLFLQWLRRGTAPPPSWGPMGQFLVFILAAVAGGLWTTLLFRQVIAAFWFTLLIPMALVVLIGESLSKYDSDLVARVVIPVLAAYAIVGFLLARRLFLHAQDSQWTGGMILLPAWRRFAWRHGLARRTRGAVFALSRKEFQLQHVSLLLGLVLITVYLVFIALLKMLPLFSRTSLATILGYFWLLSFVMPAAVGSVAVAEERKLGTLEAHLCLPVARPVQMFVKFAVALILGIFLGTMVPWVLEAITAWIDPSINVRREIFGQSSAASGLAVRAVFSGVLVAISFYASTLARTTLHALGIAFVLTVASGFITASTTVAWEPGFFLQNPVRFWTYLIGLPVVLTTLIWLGYTNYKHLRESGKAWRRDLIAVAAALISITAAANAVYQRAWERVLPLEPRHGPARLSSTQPVSLQSNIRAVAVLLSDERVWLNPVGFSRHTNVLVKLLRQERDGGAWARWPINLKQEFFVQRTNWTAIAADKQQIIGIQSDGSLWSMFRHFETNVSTALTRIGTETDWLQAAGEWRVFLLLKKDGTVWRWQPGAHSRERPSTSSAVWSRIGSDSDWAEVFQCGWRVCARKRDGRAWAYQWDQWDRRNEEFSLVPRPELDGNGWMNLSLLEMWDSCLYAGLRSDGSLWVWLGPGPRDDPGTTASSSQRIQMGQGHSWKAASISSEGLFALERNGTLWKWEWRRRRNSRDELSSLSALAPVRLGINSDWIATTPAVGSGFFSLAADGSLWFWGEHDYNPLLVRSRLPAKIAGIFDGLK